MKKYINHFMKGALLQTLSVVTLAFFISCTSTQSPEDSKVLSEKSNNEKFDNNQQKNDAQFLVDAAEMNLEEIQLGKLAQQRGTTTEVKELGRKMEEAHTQSLVQLKDLASRKGISIPATPTEDGRDAYNALLDKTGDDFNKTYTDRRVRLHRDAIDLFEDASTECQDADIRSWATASLPSLRAHHEHALEYQRRFNNMSN